MFRRTNDPKDVEALNARLLRLPAIQQAIKQDEAENEAKRKKLVADLAKLARESEREAPRLHAAYEKERAETARIRAQMEQQLGRERAAWSARDQHSSDVQRRRTLLENELRATADVRIAEFLAWCLDERTATGAKTRVMAVPGPRDPLTDRRLPSAYASNTKSVHTRMDALMTAYDRAQALQLVAGVDVEAELAKIRAAIPDADDPMALTVSLPTPGAAALEAQDADEERARRRADSWMGRLEADVRPNGATDAGGPDAAPFRVN